MKRNVFKLCAIIFGGIMVGLTDMMAQSENVCLPVSLQCEHMVRPLGIDRKSPRFTWQIADSRNGARQTAYRIAVGKDSLALSKGKKIIWQEKKSGEQMMATYGGRVLEPCTRYYWSVTVWDKDKKSSEPVISSFETGLLNQENWLGDFILRFGENRSNQTFLLRKNIQCFLIVVKQLHSIKIHKVAPCVSGRNFAWCSGKLRFFIVHFQE